MNYMICKINSGGGWSRMTVGFTKKRLFEVKENAVNNLGVISGNFEKDDNNYTNKASNSELFILHGFGYDEITNSFSSNSGWKQHEWINVEYR